MTDREKISEGNQNIAIFEGWEVHPWSLNPDGMKKGETLLALRFFDYHTNWNRLMSVVEKMEKLRFENHVSNIRFEIARTECLIHQGFWSEGRNGWQSFDDSTKKKAVWKAVAWFAKWYNEGNNKTKVYEHETH